MQLWVYLVCSVASLYVGYAIEAIGDFGNPAVPVRFAILGEVFLCSMAFFGLALGIFSLRMARNGRGEQKNNWLRPIILVIGFFFPGFLFSLPLTLFLGESHLAR